MIKLKSKLIYFISFILIVFFFINSYIQKNKKLNQISNIEVKEEDFISSNIIKDIKYSSKDLKNNQYIILAEEGEIDLNNQNVIFLKNVTAFIKMIKKNETIKIISNYGKYNTVNYETIFSKNVEITYLDGKITGDYLDFSMMKNRLIVSRNVVYKNPENILKADVIELDTITKDTKIFMYNYKEKVNIKSLN